MDLGGNRDVRLKVSVDNSEARQKLGDVDRDVDQLRDSSTKLNQTFSGQASSFKTLVGAFVTGDAILRTVTGTIRLLRGFIIDSIDSYANAEAAQRKLTAALEAYGDASPQTISRMNDLAKQFQQTTVFSDDLITEMEALFVQVGQVGPDQMGAALSAATDLAAGLGIDLRSATIMVAKAFGTGGESLRQLKQLLGDSIKPGADMTEILEAINKKFGGQAAAQIDTYAGRIQQLGNAWDDVRESFGKAIVMDPILQALLRGLVKGTTAASEATSDFTLSERLATAAIAMGQPGAAANIRMLANWAKQSNQAAEATRKMATEQKATTQAVKASADPWDKLQKSINNAVVEAYTPLSEFQKVLIRQALEYGKSTKALSEEIGVSELAIKRLMEEDKKAEKAKKEHADEVKKANEEIKKFRDSVEKLWFTQLQYNSLLPDVTSNVNTLRDAVFGMNGAVQQWLKENEKIPLILPQLKLKETSDTYMVMGQSIEFARDQQAKLNAETRRTAEEFDRARIEAFMPWIAGLDAAATGVGKFSEAGGQAVTVVADLADAMMVLGTRTATTTQRVQAGAGGILAMISLYQILDKVIADAQHRADVFAARRSIQENLGLTISPNLAEAFATEGLTRYRDQLRELSRIVADVGGVTRFNLAAITKAMQDMFGTLTDQYRRHVISLEDMAKTVEEVFPQIAEVATANGSLVSKAFLDIIAQEQALGLQTQAVTDYLRTQIESALGGLTTFLSNAQVSSEASAQAIGAAIGVSFDKLLQRGISITEALKAIEPAAVALAAQLEKTGFTGGEAFQQINRYITLAKDETAGPLLDAVSGLNQALVGLANSGLLNQDIFQGLAQQVRETYQRLIAEGKDGNDVLRLMQPTLQTIWELQQQFGLSIDDTTQALINQAKEQGLVGDQFRSAQERMALAAERTATAVEAIARALGALPAAADQAATGIQTAVARIPSSIDIGVNYIAPRDQPGEVDYAHGGGLVTTAGLQRFHGGGKVLPFAPRYHSGGLAPDEVPAILQAGEVVLSRKDVRRAVRGGVSIGEINIQIGSVNDRRHADRLADQIGDSLMRRIRQQRRLA